MGPPIPAKSVPVKPQNVIAIQRGATDHVAHAAMQSVPAKIVVVLNGASPNCISLNLAMVWHYPRGTWLCFSWKTMPLQVLEPRKE